MSNVELVVEVLSSLSEASLNILMESQTSLDDWANLFLNCSLEFTIMLVKISLINCGEGRLFWETYSEKLEMSLETWVNEERTGSWVHGSDQLSVLDILKGKLALIIPMLVVSVLSEKSNGTLGVIRITHWHIHIIHEVDELVLTNWSECLTSFLFKQLLQVHLKQVSISIEVEVDNLLEIVTVKTIGELVQKTFDNLSLSTSCLTNKNWAMVDLDELSHQVRG